MSENKENKAIDNNSSQMRPGAAAIENAGKPEISAPAEEKEISSKAPLADLDSPFKPAPEQPETEKKEQSQPEPSEKVENTAAAAPAEAVKEKKSKKSKKKDDPVEMTDEEAELMILNQRKRRKRRTTVLVIVIALVLAGSILFPNLIRFYAPKVDLSAVNVNEQVLQYQAVQNSINREFTASGTLASGNTEEIGLAGDIEVEEYFVKNGDVINKGDKIASVSQPSVMSAIVALQDKLKTLDTQLNKINSADDKTIIRADSKSRVKAIYVKKGTKCEDALTKNGALILLSLDGLMACDIDRTENTKVGDPVRVVLSNNTKASGTIVAVNTTYATCAISDTTAKFMDDVTVLDASGKDIGKSKLYIHSVLPIIAYSGTVSQVHVKLNQVVKQDTKLLTLTGTRYSGEFSNLMYKRSVLEDQMKKLFEVYQTGIVYSDHDGEVTGIKDEDEEEEEESSEKSEKLSSASKKLGTLSVKIKINNDSSNPPDPSADMKTVTNYAVVVGGFNKVDPVSGKTSYILLSNSDDLKPLGDLDYTKLNDTVTKRDQYQKTYQSDFIPSDTVPVYSYDSKNKTWVKGSSADFGFQDLLIFTFSPLSGSSDPVWIIRYPKSSSEEPGGGGQGGGQGGQGGQGGYPGGRGGFPGGYSGGGNWASIFGGRGTISSFNITSGSSSAATSGEDEEEDPYKMEETTIASIINLDTMSVTLTVDELDIININKSQNVTLTLDAIKDKSYLGKIVSIDTDGTRETNGNAKYSVKIELPRTDDMLAGMSASVKATISTAHVLSVPAEALTKKNNKTYCYTSYDKDTDTFSGEVEVKTGISDGKNVEIVSGLKEGDTIWYKYADGLVYKFMNR